MSRPKSEEVEKKWRALLEGWEASGLSLRAFASREGLNLGTLWSWKKRLRVERETATRFLPVVVSDSSARRADGFELALHDGMALRIPPDFDEATLTRLVRALGASR